MCYYQKGFNGFHVKKCNKKLGNKKILIVVSIFFTVVCNATVKLVTLQKKSQTSENLVGRKKNDKPIFLSF